MHTWTPVILSIDDGTTVVAVPACASRRTRVSESDTGTGYGETEYLSGKARRWSLFRRRVWIFTAEGHAATGLQALDLTADFWTATFRNPLDPDGADVVALVVPASPVESYAQPTAAHTFELELRETLS